jgi:hypothetical protein
VSDSGRPQYGRHGGENRAERTYGHG